MGGASCVFGEQVVQVLWSQIIQRPEDHCFRIITNEFFNGLPAQLHNEWSVRGIEAAVCNDSNSMLLELLQLVDVSTVDPLEPQT